jgi:sulfur carrier protein ThiS
VKVRVKLHGETKRHVKGLVGDSIDVELGAGATVKQLLHQLSVADEDVWMSAVNKDVVKGDHVLADGDSVEVFAPVQGGSLHRG